MRLVVYLALVHVASHWIRNVLTVLAASFSVCLIVWVFGTYDAVLDKSEDALTRLLGPYDAVLFAAHNLEIPLPREEIDWIAESPNVGEYKAMAMVPVWRINPDAKKAQRPFGPTAVAGDLREPLFELREGRWLSENAPLREPFEAVLSDSEADTFDLKLGEVFTANTRGGQFRMKLVGILRQPAITRMLGGMYVAPKTIERLGGRVFAPNLLLITLKQDVDAEAFEKGWKERHENPGDDAAAPEEDGEKSEAAATKSTAQLVLLGEMRRDLSSGGLIGHLRVQGLYSATLACLAGSFIICITLSMGVDERVRQFALLRAVALTRRQTAGMLVAESVALSLAGLAVGVFFGWILLCGTAFFNPELFDTIPTVSGQCVLMCALSLLFGAVLAAVPPVFSALRVRPLDVTVPTGRASAARFPLLAMAAGLGLILVQPINVFVLDIPVSPLYWVLVFLGSVCHAVGFLLLSPTFVLLTEKLFTAPVGFALHIDRRLLGDQLSANFWRSAATAAALTIGLGLFVSVQIWGNSMLEPFLPGEGLPDLIVSFQPAGLIEEDLADVAAAPGLTPEGCLPVAIARPDVRLGAFGKEPTPEKEKRRKKNTLLVLGIDPDRGIGARRPVLHMRFLEGDAALAAAKLKEGNGVVIPDTLAARTGLGLGDRFRVEGTQSDEGSREYEVAGVVTIPGWQMVTHLSGMQQRGSRSVGAVFASFEGVRRDYGIERINHVWASMAKGSDVDAIKRHMQALAERNAGISVTLPFIGKVTAFKPFVNVLKTEEIEAAVRRRAGYVIWLASVFPIVALLVASVAVANTIMASIRARRWEFGVLRSVALTRGNLVRLVLGESILLGLVACLLSLAAGVHSAWCGMGIAAHLVLGDIRPPLVLPWGALLAGFATAITFALLAAIVPAWATARREPLSLLQSGRSAM